jgi:hypothetical protein
MHFTLSDMLSDLTQNAVEAGATVVRVSVRETDRDFSATIEDNGKGMTDSQLSRARDPFYTDGVKHPGRKVGLGIPFLIQTAETTGGSWGIRSRKDGEKEAVIGTCASDAAKCLERIAGHGTTVECRIDLTNIDAPPAGDVVGFFRQVLTFDAKYEMEISRILERDGLRREYEVRRSDLLDALGLLEEGAFSDVDSLALVGRYLESMEE